MRSTTGAERGKRHHRVGARQVNEVGVLPAGQQ